LGPDAANSSRFRLHPVSARQAHTAPFQYFAVFGVLTGQRKRAKLAAMKRKKAQVEKASVGTVVGAKYRARCNDLSDSEREKLNDEFLKLYYGGSVPQPARRR
jgi:hypothetical protein